MSGSLVVAAARSAAAVISVTVEFLQLEEDAG